LKLLVLLLADLLVPSASLCAQEPQTLVDNDQLKFEVTSGLERCTATAVAGVTSSRDPNAISTCTEFAITNKSGAPITAWAVVVTWTPRFQGVSSGDSLPDLPSKLISPRVTCREGAIGATQADLKAAVFSDGSVFGEAEWIGQIVQNRRETYRDTIIALQKLREAKEAGTPREQLVREFRDLQRQETKQELGSPRSLNAGVPPKLPNLRLLFTDIAHELEWKHEGSDDDTLPNDIDRLESMMLEFGKRLLDSKPPITDHPVEPGEPIERGSAPR
jgi:hypothetical protein